jgi:hypothetical protein
MGHSLAIQIGPGVTLAVFPSIGFIPGFGDRVCAVGFGGPQKHGLRGDNACVP